MDLLAQFANYAASQVYQTHARCALCAKVTHRDTFEQRSLTQRHDALRFDRLDRAYPRQYHVLEPEQKSRAIELLRAKEPYRSVARILGVSLKQIQNVAKEMKQLAQISVPLHIVKAEDVDILPMIERVVADDIRGTVKLAAKLQKLAEAPNADTGLIAMVENLRLKRLQILLPYMKGLESKPGDITASTDFDELDDATLMRHRGDDAGVA